jgi:hypothetical protein
MANASLAIAIATGNGMVPIAALSNWRLLTARN